MRKKLSPEKLNEILEAGIAEFAAHGPERASVQVIARSADVSVGVLYKYYENKDALFLACLRHALLALDAAIAEALSGELPVAARAEKLIRAVQRSAKREPAYHVLYHEITAGGCKRYAPALAGEIEGISARVYAAMLADAQREGRVRADMEPRLFAFFFDNLLMMLQFSYACDYYRARFAIYCGADASDDEKVVSELVKFLSAAFGEREAGANEKRSEWEGE